MFRRLARISAPTSTPVSAMCCSNAALSTWRLRGLCLRPFAFAVCLCAAASISRGNAAPSAGFSLGNTTSFNRERRRGTAKTWRSYTMSDRMFDAGVQTGAAPGHRVTQEVALVDFEIVLAADFADIPDIGAHGFRKYFRLSANDFESVGRQDLDHVRLREREVR